MERTAVRLVEPIARVQRQEFHLRPFRQIRGLVNDKSASPNARLEGHANQAITARAAQQPLSGLPVSRGH